MAPAWQQARTAPGTQHTVIRWKSSSSYEALLLALEAPAVERALSPLSVAVIWWRTSHSLPLAPQMASLDECQWPLDIHVCSSPLPPMEVEEP